MHQPTLRVLRVLEYMTRHRSDQRLADLSRGLQIPKSTLIPILQTLCACNYLKQEENGRYSIGTAGFFLEKTHFDSF